MVIEIKCDCHTTPPAYLLTLYEIIEELNLYTQCEIREIYNPDKRRYSNTRVVEIYGSDTMVSWLILRMQRYLHQVESLNAGKSVIGSILEE